MGYLFLPSLIVPPADKNNYASSATAPPGHVLSHVPVEKRVNSSASRLRRLSALLRAQLVCIRTYDKPVRCRTIQYTCGTLTRGRLVRQLIAYRVTVMPLAALVGRFRASLQFAP